MNVFKVACLLPLVHMGLAEGESAAGSVMTGFDTNKDGLISLRELKDHVGNNPGFAGWEAGFKEADANQDGQLELKELEALLSHATKQEQEVMVDESEEGIAKSIMDGFDTNKDGKLSLDELKLHVEGNDLHATSTFKGWEEGFSQADTDKDQHLTVHELAGLLKQVNIEDQKALIDSSEHTVARSIMDGFDTNKDHKISLGELMEHVGDNTNVHAAFAGWTAGFKEADADSDGHLDIEELASMLSRISRDDQQELVGESEQSLAASIMDGFDTNKDHHLSLKELEDHVGKKEELQAAFKGWQEGFTQADADKDGILSIKELASLLKHVSIEEQEEMVHDSEKSIGESIMDGFDVDKDRKLTLQELMQHVGTHGHIDAAFKGWKEGFKHADIDDDGHLTAEELTTLITLVSKKDQEKMVREAHKETALQVLGGFDTNKDGKIGLKELMEHVGDKTHVHAAFAGWSVGFKQADADEDGHLDVEELTTLLEMVSREEQHEMVEQSDESMAASIMDGFDTDKDGKLSLKELQDHVGEKKLHASFPDWEVGFHEADVEKDGHLTVKELGSLLSKVSRQDQDDMILESERSVGEQIMDGFDADSDGKISLKELTDHVGDSEHVNAAFAGWKEGFDQADADKDGHLTSEELTSLLTHVSRLDQEKMMAESKASMVSYFKDSFDGDKNGKLSLEELKQHMDGDSHIHSMFEGWKDGFSAADADNDAHLSDDEIHAFLEHAGKGVKKSLEDKGRRRMAMSMILSFDSDKDGKVSLKEVLDHMAKKNTNVQTFLDGWTAGFKDADVDFDGLLDEEEMEALVAHVHRQHRHKLVEESDATAAQILSGFDADSDGKISMKELEEKVGKNSGFKGWEAGFKEADADSDGFLTAGELAEWFKLITPELPKHDEM